MELGSLLLTIALNTTISSGEICGAKSIRCLTDNTFCRCFNFAGYTFDVGAQQSCNAGLLCSELETFENPCTDKSLPVISPSSTILDLMSTTPLDKPSDTVSSQSTTEEPLAPTENPRGPNEVSRAPTLQPSSSTEESPKLPSSILPSSSTTTTSTTTAEPLTPPPPPACSKKAHKGNYPLYDENGFLLCQSYQECSGFLYFTLAVKNCSNGMGYSVNDRKCVPKEC